MNMKKDARNGARVDNGVLTFEFLDVGFLRLDLKELEEEIGGGGGRGRHDKK